MRPTVSYWKTSYTKYFLFRRTATKDKIGKKHNKKKMTFADIFCQLIRLFCQWLQWNLNCAHTIYRLLIITKWFCISSTPVRLYQFIIERMASDLMIATCTMKQATSKFNLSTGKNRLALVESSMLAFALIVCVNILRIQIRYAWKWNSEWCAPCKMKWKQKRTRFISKSAEIQFSIWKCLE